MPESSALRQLRAILHADVAGFSVKMEKDDEGTLRALQACRGIFDVRIRQGNGRIVNAPGDALLAEFASVLDAVRTAVEVQQELALRNGGLPPQAQMEFRIGINLGDILIEKGEIYGDGVNVAARLERFAEPGGICISGSVYELVRDQLPYGFKNLGRHPFKNIAEPVRVFQVMGESGQGFQPWYRATRFWGRLSSRERLRVFAAGIVALVAMVWVLASGGRLPGIGWLAESERYPPLPEQPSLAVLALENLSGDPSLEYLGDGTSEEILTNLAKVPGLFVISRHSAFSYKGRRLDLRQVGRELGVRYVLVGGFRTGNERVRISVRLNETPTGRQVWGETFEGPLNNILRFQEQITRKVVEALEVQLTEGQQVRIWHGTTDNPGAWVLFMQGVSHLRKVTAEGVAAAKTLFRNALAHDPNFAAAHAALGLAHYVSARYSYGDPRQELTRAAEQAERAIASEPNLGEAHCLLGLIQMAAQNYEQAIALCRAGADKAPNNGEVAALYAMVLNHAGRPKEGLVSIRQAMRQNPNFPDWYLYQQALANYLNGRHEKTVTLFERYLERDPEGRAARLVLAAAYGKQGREDDVRRVMRDFREHHPGLSPRKFLMQSEPFRDQQVIEGILDAIRTGTAR